MPDEQAAKFVALNTQLVALDEAGVPLDVGAHGSELRRQLDEASRVVSAGGAIEQAIAEPAAPPAYRRLVTEWLGGADLGDLLAASGSVASQDDDYRRQITIGLAYPIAVATAACIGLAVMVHTVFPTIESVYTDLQEPVSGGAALLQTVRRSAPIWVWAAPLLLVAGVVGVRHWQPLRWTRRSYRPGPKARSKLAQVCHEVASSLEAGMRGEQVAELVDTPEPTPPLFAWARQAMPAGDAQAKDFRAIGSTYQSLAQRSARRWSSFLPLAACVIVGGGATLLYGLALFVPIVELLWTLAF
ncbi:MAG: type II secretion system F family protein [Planctomycetota bacterium]